MNVKSFNCILCHYPFDDSIHLPRILYNCSHTICSLCLSKSILTKSKTFKCPKDNTIYSNIENIDIFPINQLMLNNIIKVSNNFSDENKLSKNESKKSIKTQKTSKTKLDTFSFSDTILSNNNILPSNNSVTNTNTNLNSNLSNSNINLASPRCYVKKTIKFNQNKKINFLENSLICSLHSLPLNVICVNDKQKICGQCALNNIHLNHHIIPEQKFIQFVDELVKVFQQIENNQNNDIEIDDTKTNNILEKIDNKIQRSKNKIKNICIDLIDNINSQFRLIEKILDLRKNDVFKKFKFINYNINNLKESANSWMEIISSKLIEANTGSIEDINLDCLKLLDLDPNKNIFNLINTGKQINERYNFIKEMKDMIEKLNKFSQNGINIIPNNSIIETIKTLTIINEKSQNQKQNILYNQNVMTTMDNRDRNTIYKNTKIFNFNFINNNNLETPLFKIEENKDLIEGLHLTPIGGLYDQIKNINNSKGYENSILFENNQCNTISNLSNLYSARNQINEIVCDINNNNTNKIYSKKKLDDFYSKEYIINFKNMIDNKTETQINFYNSNKDKNNSEIYIKKVNSKEQSPKNKLSLSGSYQRYNTQYANNLEKMHFKNGIIAPLSPINKKDLFPKLIREKTCDVSFIASKKRRNSCDSLVINSDINCLHNNHNSNINRITLSPPMKSIYNIMNNNMTNIFSTHQELRTLEKYQNKNNGNYKSDSINKSIKNKNKGNKFKNKLKRCDSCSGLLLNKNELEDIPIFYNNKNKKINNKTIGSLPKKSIKENIIEISNFGNINNKSINNRNFNKHSSKEGSNKTYNNRNNNFSIAIQNNLNNKNSSYVTKEENELKECINLQKEKINPCFNHINMKGKGIQILCDCFKKNKNIKLKELKLVGCNLHDEDFVQLIKNIIENEIEIGTLNATNNQIGDNSFKFIFEMIKKVKGLKNIFLYNNIFSKGFKDKIKNYDRDNSLYNVRLFL